MKKRPELDIIRGVAIVAVLVIHATAQGTVDLPIHGKAQALYLALNKISNFAVLTFLWLSALVLFYRYYPTWRAKDSWTFYRKRIQYIVVPYLIWSFFYHVYNPWITDSGNGRWVNWPVFFQDLRWGDAGYHLYFIVIIVQFYVLFPLLITLAKGWPPFARALPWIGIAVEAGAYAVHHWISPLPERACLAVTYAGVLGVGCWMGIHYDRIVQAAEKYRLAVFLGAPLLGLWLFALHELGERGITYGGQAMFEATRDLYAVAIGLFFILVGRRMLERSTLSAQLLLSCSAASFGIYFSHPAWLTAWRTFVTEPPGTPGYHWSTLGSLLVILVLPWVSVLAVKRIPGSWVLLGR